MKILITGAHGQLGSEIKEIAKNYNGWQFLYTDVDSLDITDESSVRSFFSNESPDFVVNCAAYTAVDKAEEDEKAAYLINATAPGLLAEVTNENNIGFIHVSTDYVFDGDGNRPYNEEDLVNPQSVYGNTKLEGEKNCNNKNQHSIIIRTSWLYSSYGNNFVKTMLRLGKEKDELNVVFDQVGSPTYGGDLAYAVLNIIEKYDEDREKIIPGVYHYSNEGAISWYDFAKAIFEISRLNCILNPILSKEFKMAAPRPHYSVFDKSKIKDNFQLEVPYWKDSLKLCLEKLIK